MLKAKNIRLYNLKDAKRQYSRIFNELYHDQLEHNKARTLIYVLNSFVRSLELSEIEKRLQALEERIAQ